MIELSRGPNEPNADSTNKGKKKKKTKDLILRVKMVFLNKNSWVHSLKLALFSVLSLLLPL